jgi:hypothetical protein
VPTVTLAHALAGPASGPAVGGSYQLDGGFQTRLSNTAVPERLFQDGFEQTPDRCIAR